MRTDGRTQSVLIVGLGFGRSGPREVRREGLKGKLGLAIARPSDAVPMTRRILTTLLLGVAAISQAAFAHRRHQSLGDRW